jgi:HD-like signal output (HDOD) protein
MTQQILDAAMLAGLHPVSDLDPEKRISLAQRGHFDDLRYNQKIDASQENRWLLYLVDGSVRLSHGQEEITIAAGSARAHQPLFSKGNLHETAVALTRGRLLRLDRGLFEVLQRQEQQSGYEIEEIDLNGTESTLFVELYEACSSGKIELPALPDVALKIQAAMKDPDVDIRRLAGIVSADIAIAGGLVQAAGSAVYGTGNPVRSVRDAIVRIGLTASRRLAMTIAMQRVFRPSSSVIKQRMQELWQRSLHVSVLSFVIARSVKGIDAEQALLAGLLNEVGTIPILDYVGKRYPDVSVEELDATVSKLQGIVGELVVRSWNLGPEMALVIRDAGNPDRRQGTDKGDLSDVVIVARNYHSSLDSSAGESEEPFYALPSFVRLGLEPPAEDGTLSIVENAGDEIREMMAVLHGG